jgi:hypothetical protein
MNLTSLLVLLCASLLLCSNTTRAEEPAVADQVAERLFPPDLILYNGEAIGLSDEKRQEILSRMEKAQARFRGLESALVKERAAVVALLDTQKPDETAVLKQLDNLLAREQDIKREQFGLMLSLRNMLTAPQQVRLKELRKNYTPSAAESRLKEKLGRVEAGLQKLASNGGNPSSIEEQMQKFPELMRTGKLKGAEELLDGVLDELEAK